MLRKLASLLVLMTAAVVWTLSIMALVACAVGLLVTGSMGFAVGAMVSSSLMLLADAIGESV